jgi:AraC-like DNA-binding protein
VLQEAEQNAEETEADEGQGESYVMDEADRQHVEAIVGKWLAEGRHLKSGITMQTACADMNLPRYQLNLWLKTTEWELFSHWLTYLRIEEAKRLLIEHPDWSNDTIAAHCGFNTRNYFHTVFRKQTGMTPAQYFEKSSM